MVPPSGRDYELWVIRDGAPVSLGVIRADETGRADLRIENVGVSSAISAFAVSMETTGGSLNKNAPSGPVVMLGPLGS
jgi:anti-sigma-K factor RskA